MTHLRAAAPLRRASIAEETKDEDRTVCSRVETLPDAGAAALALALAVAGLAAPAAAEPAFAWDDALDMPPGAETYIPVQGVFTDSGTNPVFNSVTFSTTTYIDSSRSGFGSVPSAASIPARTGANSWWWPC